jgi:hypothetical protein
VKVEVKARTKTVIKAGDRYEGHQGCYSQKSTMPSLLFVRPLHRQEEAEFEAFECDTLECEMAVHRKRYGCRG